jgi:hypothetical protein
MDKELKEELKTIKLNQVHLGSSTMFCIGIAILCLQDAPLLSINSIAPGVMAFMGLANWSW